MNEGSEDSSTPMLTATVLSAARRELKLLTKAGIINAKRAGQVRSVCAGDLVKYDLRGNDNFAFEQIQRKNYISRSSKGQEQVLAANLDLLCIVTAASNQYSPLFVDRVLCVANCENIPALVVVNKSDLSQAQAREICELYRSLNVDVVCCSAKDGQLNELQQRLENKSLNSVALLGLSGVGKSTILNRLVPEAHRETQSVSTKTGHGKQTTTLARGFLMKRIAQEDLILIDLPGIQRFGIDHLLVQKLEQLFPEFLQVSTDCKYRDCKHLLEDQCAVKDAVNESKIPLTRYQSYQHLAQELKQAKAYQYST